MPCSEEDAVEARYNNRKLTFDRLSRKALYGIFEDAGGRLCVSRESTCLAGAGSEESSGGDGTRCGRGVEEVIGHRGIGPAAGLDEDIPGIIRENWPCVGAGAGMEAPKALGDP